MLPGRLLPFLLLLLLLAACAWAQVPAVVAPASDSNPSAPMDSLGLKPPAADARPGPEMKPAKDAKDTLDSLPYIPRNYGLASPYGQAETCDDAQEGAYGCWRRSDDLANQETGFPGRRAWTLSLTRWEPLPLHSPFLPAGRHSPYLSGGLMAPERYALKRSGGNAIGLEEIWSPVIPLDTPVTNLGWERGALTLNMFHLKLRRMLSEQVYLALDYYSTSADSATYDYQFNVHQPYIGGWAFLGKIYAPIDRDSSSLVLEGNSLAIGATHFRPRIGFWLDTNQVVEVFLDRVKNTSDLARPRGPVDATRPGREDSTQARLASEYSSFTGGALHAYAGSGWSSQWEATLTSVEKGTARGDSGSGLAGASTSGEDNWSGSLLRMRGRLAATEWPGRPYVETEAASGIWDGELFLHGNRGRGRPADEGWEDRQGLGLGLRPRFGPLELEADAGLARSSRMGDKAYWLPRGGGRAEASLPGGLSVWAGGDYEARDADFETLYRHQPALFLYPSPGLLPRQDFGFRGGVTWKLPFASLGAGADLARSGDAWLPHVLPAPDACADLADATGGGYRYPIPPLCKDGALPDSLALRLRNWERAETDAWKLSLGLALGNWSLDVENRFVFNNRVTDAVLSGTRANRAVPDRVFKGRLGWRRRLIDNRMLVNIGWEWEWISTRYAWAPKLDGTSAPVKLDEYLVLDFLASMEIKTFLLYFKGMNFNHDRYSTQPGVHPTGVNFRFGVDWALWN